MFSKILIKLIDHSIIPAILLLATRVASIILIGKYFGINVLLTTTGFKYATRGDYLMVNSYSTLAMIVVLALGLFYVLVKSLVFHDTHVTPRLTARLFSLRLSSFIQTSFDVYSQGAVWLSYLYLLMFVCGVMALFGLIFPWVFFVSVGLALVATVLLVLDIEGELQLSREDSDSEIEEIVLTFEENFDEDF